jgi:hypothetical protein
MKQFLPYFGSLFVALAPLASAEMADDEVAMRSDVLDLAGAFQNDGFKLRDGTWFGKISKDHAATIQVNLYSGNAYWFSVAGTKSATDLKITVYDSTGHPVATEPYRSENKTASGFSPDSSGLYFVKVSSDAAQPTGFCLIYSYK